MTRMPEPSRNLPIPAEEAIKPGESQVLSWPLKQPKPRMNAPLLAAVTDYIESQGGGQGLFPTAIDGFNIVRSFQSMMPMRNIYRPSLCVVLEGAKELQFGDKRLNYQTMECLVVSVGLPATGRIVEASEEVPYVGVMIDFDVATLRSVLEQLEAIPVQPEEPGPCAFVAKVDQPLADCILRLVTLLATPKAIPVLAPSIVREICYWLLSGPHGGELCKLALPESNIERVVRAVSVLHTNFAEPIRVEKLADIARMSPSSFHQHFKALTSMTPLQFQKQLRLLEARRLMVTEAANVAEAAYKVGYESASQFSREYSRTFGVAPKQDVLTQQRLHHVYASRTVSASP
jgi:AraC-like DNA-binding protein